MSSEELAPFVGNHLPVRARLPVDFTMHENINPIGQQTPIIRASDPRKLTLGRLGSSSGVFSSDDSEVSRRK